MRRVFVLAGCAVLLATLSPAAFAQKDIDISRLERYYTESLKSEKNRASYESLIASEREHIRSAVQESIDALVQPPAGEADVEASKAQDRQRQVVQDLRERLNEATVDLNLLKDEEKVYQNGGGSASGVYMTTKSYPELLAKRVVLEEETSALSAALPTQESRLEGLLMEERSKNLGLLLTILWYILIFFVTVTLESFIRTQLILRLPQRRVRYMAAKVFTLLVYLSLFFWLAQQLLQQYPGFTTIFAVIGAALIIMLQDVIKAFLGWLTYRGAVKLGDRIMIGDYTGDVLDISMLHTTLLASRAPNMGDVSQAGKVVRVPNTLYLTGTLINYQSTSDFENVEIPLYLADVTQAERAKKFLGELLADEASSYAEQARRQMDRRMRGFYFSQVSPSIRVYMEMTDKRELKLTLCFPAPIGQRRQVTTKILQRVLERFEEEGIGLAKPA